MLYMLRRGVNLNSNERTKAEKGSTPDRSGASKHLRFAWVLGVGFRVWAGSRVVPVPRVYGRVV